MWSVQRTLQITHTNMPKHYFTKTNMLASLLFTASFNSFLPSVDATGVNTVAAEGDSSSDNSGAGAHGSSASAAGTVSSTNPTSASTTLATSATSASSSNNSNNIRSKMKCFSYGCPMLPRDMFFDEEVQAALKTLRTLHNKDDDTSTTSSTTSTSSSSSSSGSIDSFSIGANSALSEALESLSTSGHDDQATLTLIGYKGGRIEDQINQDRAFVVAPFQLSSSSSSQDNHEEQRNDGTASLPPSSITTSLQDNTFQPKRLLGVFDGHAKLGELISEYSVQNLPKLLSSKLNDILSSSSPDNNTNNNNHTKAIQQAMVDTFIEIDKNAPAEKSGGCTATIVLQLASQIYIANAGDSRSFIATYDPSNTTSNPVKIVYVTREDKPCVPEEKERVEMMGGQVYEPPPERKAYGASSRVLYVDKKTGRTNGLAMSRSIGDWDYGKLGVIPDPTVVVLDMHDIMRGGDGTGTATNSEQCASSSSSGGDDQQIQVFAVSASDGLLDFVDIEEIANSIATSLYVDEGPHPLSACESLITTSATAWYQAKQGRYRDDIAIAVSKLSL